MFVTLDVSRLSGWLNADAARNIPCMVTTLEVSKLSGWLNAAALWNMYCMFVTLDVSKLSGWLNADARCRVTPRHVEGDTGVGGARACGGGAVVQAACAEEPTGHWA